MQFANGHMFFLLWLLIPLAVLFSWVLSLRLRKMKQFAQENLFADIAPEFSLSGIKKRNVLLLFVFIFSVIALARPQLGFQWQEVKRQGLDILVVVDVSKSMLTQDVKPSRLERTKLAIKDLLRKLKGDRIGLIAFSGDAFLFCPFTVDYNGFLLSLNDLNVNTISRGGTNLAVAIEEAMKSYKNIESKYKAIVIVSDGDNLQGDPRPIARKAKENGIKIYSIGIGTKAGELIQIQDEYGEKKFLKDQNGNFVKSRLNEKLLKDISLLTGGVYVKSSGANFGLDFIYEKELSKLEKREIEIKKTKKYYERFQIPLAIACFLLLIATCLKGNI